MLNTKKNLKRLYLKWYFLIKKSIIVIILKTRIIITFIRFTTSIIFIKIKIDVNAKKLIYYNYNQISYIKRDYFYSDKKIA